MTSITTFTTAADTYKTRSNSNLLSLQGGVQFGSFFSSTQISVGGPATSGSFSDIFPAFPAANFSGDVTTGKVFEFIQDVGHNFIQLPDLKAGAFVGYHLFTEQLNGSTAAFPTRETLLLDDRWQGVRVGAGFEKTFLGSGTSVSMSLVGMPYVTFQSGAFTADGWGMQGNAAITFPVPSVNPNLSFGLFVRDTYTTVSGNTAGPGSVPMDVKNNNFTAGVRGIYHTRDEFSGLIRPLRPGPVLPPIGE